MKRFEELTHASPDEVLWFFCCVFRTSVLFCSKEIFDKLQKLPLLKF
jgi:hypothetical protein